MANNDALMLAPFRAFENVALGVRDAKYAKFDLACVMERDERSGGYLIRRIAHQQ